MTFSHVWFHQERCGTAMIERVLRVDWHHVLSGRCQ